VARLAGSRPRSRRPGRLRRFVERLVLGVVFGLATFVLERRLRKALGKKGKRPTKSRTIEIS
jgi:hypothetical protein